MNYRLAYRVNIRMTAHIFTFNLLKEAKAFLCWDVFPQLAIQLTPAQHATAYYYPPSAHHSIVVFYLDSPDSHKEAFCLLFHEAGHLVQQQHYAQSDRENDFIAMLNLDKGPVKQRFERQAWDFGRELLQQFLSGKKIATAIVLKQYDLYADKSLDTYGDI